MKLVAIPGALREGSLNKQLLKLATKLLEGAGVEIERIDFRALAIPIYDGERIGRKRAILLRSSGKGCSVTSLIGGEERAGGDDLASERGDSSGQAARSVGRTRRAGVADWGARSGCVGPVAGVSRRAAR